MRPIRKILVANRGEIAVRVIRTCRELGIGTVAVYSDADRSALHVQMADEAYCVGPPPSRDSYLNQEAILLAAKRSEANAIHPGYGFLSENAAFARACSSAGVTFIGPPPSAIDAMGEKTRARSTMQKSGVTVVPGSNSPFPTAGDALRYASEIGFPVMLKAAGGGGGKGMRRVESPSGFEEAWNTARREALGAFGNDAVYLEKYLEGPHHVEIQILADTHGTCVHLNERECSAQRRNQKVIEETPSPILTPTLREKMGALAVRAAQSVGYVGAGTVEFLVDVHRNFYFLEMNTRLQVEHPVTEWVTGLDLVAWQIRIAQGERLPWTTTPPAHGHSIEARVYAEDPSAGFMPSPGTISFLNTPSGPWVRDDSGVYAGYTVPSVYDAMISKVSVWGANRGEAIARLRRSLEEYRIHGITTNIPYLLAILAHPDFVAGDYDTGLLSGAHAQLVRQPQLDTMSIAIAAALHEENNLPQPLGPSPGGELTTSSWRRFRRGTGWRS